MDWKAHKYTYLEFLYFLTGFLSFTIEILCFRANELVLGTYATSVVVILSGYMLGISLGSAAAGVVLEKKWTSAKKILWLVHILMASTGIALVSEKPLLGFASIFSGKYQTAIAFVFAASVSFPVGAAFPAIAGSIQRSQKGTLLARTYGINIIGGVIGVIFTTYMLLPTYGQKNTALIASLSSLTLSFLYLLIRENNRVTPELEKKTPKKPWSSTDTSDSTKPLILFLTALLVGFLGMSAETLVSRILAPIVGISIFAVSATIVPFILGLGLGGILAKKLGEKGGKTAWQLATIATSASALPLLLLADRAPATVIWLAKTFSRGDISWLWLTISTMFVSSAFVIPLSTSAGCLYPLLFTITEAETGLGPGTAGFLNAFNTLGAVLGPALTGYSFIPKLGIHASLKAVAAGYAALGIFSFFTKGRRNATVMFITILLLGVVALSPKPDPLEIHSGVYWAAKLYGRKNVTPLTKLSKSLGGKKFLHKVIEGATATVLVVSEGEQKYLIIEGKPASNTRIDRKTQRALADIPLTLNPDAKKVLIIGWGSGQTAAETLKYHVEEVVCVEISPEVLSTALWFRSVNERALTDTRIKIAIDDARHFLSRTGEKFDVIISQPSNPWVGMSGFLFTREFFEICREKLKPGGVMVQWFQTYGASIHDIRVFTDTFSSIFSPWALFSPTPGDLVYIAPIEKNMLEKIERKYRKGFVGYSEFYAGNKEVVLNTDDKPILTYSLARRVLEIDRLADLRQLFRKD